MQEHREQVVAWHAEACAEARRHERTADDQPCVHCSNSKKDHFPDGRCSVHVTAPHFAAKNQTEVNRTKATILALEELARVCGWEL